MQEPFPRALRALPLQSSTSFEAHYILELTSDQTKRLHLLIRRNHNSGLNLQVQWDISKICVNLTTSIATTNTDVVVMLETPNNSDVAILNEAS